MNKGVKIALIVTGFTVVGGLVSYPIVKRSFIRKRLNEAYSDPSAESSVGGLDKLLVAEIFDIRRFNESSNKATISRLEARQRAEMIWESYSTWLSSNSTAIISAFNGLGHLDDVSKIAYEFYNSYDEELLSVIKTTLSEKSQYNLFLGKIAQLTEK